jgi:serine O-acetyltransferase
MSIKRYTFTELVRSDVTVQFEKRLEIPGQVGLWLTLKEFLNPRFAPVFLYRLMQESSLRKAPLLAKIFSILNTMLFGIEIAQRCDIGPGLFLPHTQGTVLGAVSIGSNAVIFQNVTFGAADADLSYSPGTRPIVGAYVTAGAGSKVIGGVTIGDYSVIGANAVVLRSLEPGSVAVGVPAKVVRFLPVPSE